MQELHPESHPVSPMYGGVITPGSSQLCQFIDPSSLGLPPGGEFEENQPVLGPVLAWYVLEVQVDGMGIFEAPPTCLDVTLHQTADAMHEGDFGLGLRRE
ncbi:MAG: hypothetical protein GWN58_43865 [Anaerolineae bacterium]|nr:hypothetical protein [Anaerolineae bacterium]